MTKIRSRKILNLTRANDRRRFTHDHVHVNGRCVKNGFGPLCADPSLGLFRVHRGRYKTKQGERSRGFGANVLPHGVTVHMTTLRNGKARWSYTEEFKANQFPSKAAAAQAMANTIEMCRSQPSDGLKISARGRRVTITGTTSREDFADAMAGEFISWGGKIGKITIAHFFLTSMRMIFAGWQP